ncbi:MAG: type II and III secretion system protein family protein [Anderseniella sp.]
MYPSLLSMPRLDMGTKTPAGAIVSLVAAIAVFLIVLTAAFTPAQAGDDSRFLRMGLNKSVAIRLPVAAKDVLVGNPAIVDAVVRTRTTAYLFAKANGQTNIFFFDDAGRQILNLDIEVAADTKALKQLLDRTLPDNQIKIDTVADSIVLRGVAASAGQAKQATDLAERFLGAAGVDGSAKVVSAMTIAAREQVTLRVRIAEVQRDVLKQLGVDYNAAFASGSFSAGMLTGNPFLLNGALGSGTLPTNAISGLGGAGALTGSRLQYGDSIDALVQAMEQDGLLRTLAEPTLTAISGESAKFLAGGEFPIPVSVDDNTISVEFKEFGVALGYSPVVLSSGRISLKINTEVSELTPQNGIQVTGITLPGLTTRKAETTIELPSGGSMIMAGLIRDQTRQQIAGIPGAKDLPILGQLFRSRDFQKNTSELTVMVTPFIVKPVNERSLTNPAETLSIATDRQTILFGRLNKMYGNQGGTGKGTTYHGNVGFIVE